MNHTNSEQILGKSGNHKILEMTVTNQNYNHYKIISYRNLKNTSHHSGSKI